MKLIPLFAAFNLSSAIVALSCALVILLRHKKAIFDNVFIFRFLIVFLLYGGYFGLNSAPIFTKNALLIQVIFNTSEVLALVGIICLLSIPLTFFLREKKLLLVIFFTSIIGFTIFYLGYNLLSLKPAEKVIFEPFIEWRGSTNTTILTAFWLTILMGVLIFVFLIFQEGWFHSDPIVKKRSRFMIFGFLIMITGAIVNYIFMIAPLFKTISSIPILGTLATVIVSIGFLIMLKVVLTKEQ